MNSRYQKYGRSLIVEYFQKGMVSDSSIGVGILDLEGLIVSNRKDAVKVYLNYESKRLGWVLLKADFE